MYPLAGPVADFTSWPALCGGNFVLVSEDPLFARARRRTRHCRALPRSPTRRRGSRMILVVDDHDDTRHVLIKLLNASGYEALGVCDGAQALLFLKTHRPKLMILDCHMPCLNGFDVLRAIRSDAALADLPVLMFSADAAAEGPALQHGAQGFIVKGPAPSAHFRNKACGGGCVRVLLC